MTEGNDDGNNLVRVRAQVMMRDDSTGLWVPMGGGGFSNVSVRKRILHTDPDEVEPEYFIYGKRISDQRVVLSCTIKKDFQYNKVMPTFHHWVTGDHKFGLTFQTAADARAFDKGVRLAVDDIREGLNEIPSYRHGHHNHHHHHHHHLHRYEDDDEVFVAVNLPVERDGSRSSSGSVTTCSSGSRHTPTTTPLPTPDHPPHHITTANTSHKTGDLPHHHFHHHLHHHHHHHVSHNNSNNSIAGGCTTTAVGLSTTNTSPASTLSNPATTTIASSAPGIQQPHSNHHHHHLHRMTYLPRHKPLPGTNGTSEKGFGDTEKGDHDKIQVLGDSYSYVQFAKNQPPPNHDYSYPMVEGFGKGERRDSIASLKKHQQLELVGGTPSQPLPPPLLPGKRSRKRDRRNRKLVRARCRYCQDSFTEEYNARGSCEFAPDYVRSAIDKLTCISCAQCMLYHCMSDAEGEFPNHPCECGGPNDESCGRRWLGLTLLSLLVPCLWCYLPLRTCHRCAVSCGLCGGRHEAS
ncbi:UNVERIFIED_CONTAM: hypothetical protein RMT77_000662 [Armadillidium vulgare]